MSRLSERLQRCLRILANERSAWPKLIAIWFLINVTLNARYPETQALSDCVRPTWEATALFFGYAGLVVLGRGVPGWLHWVLIGMLLSARTLRFVDGCYVHIFHRHFRVAIDLPLLPESVRLLVATDGLITSIVKLSLVGLIVMWFCALLLFALRETERCLVQVLRRGSGPATARPRLDPERRSKDLTALLRQPVAAGLQGAKAEASQLIGAHGAFVLLLGLGSVPLAQSKLEDSISARVVSEARFIWDFPEVSQKAKARFEQVSLALERTPHHLNALRGRDVTLIIIESYGRGALDSQQHPGAIQLALQRFERRIAGSGRSIASSWLGSPSYGGGSWYAHATLTTGVHVWSPLDYKLLLDSSAPALSHFMSRAGYRTVNVMPGTTELWPEGSFYGFDQALYAKDFDYKGPSLGWGRFPDQYVLDQVRRRVSGKGAPLFKEIKLVTSHVPWRAVPRALSDWDSIGDGQLYHSLEVQRFALKWSDLKDAHWPYLLSIIYDLDVVGDFVAEFEPNDSLVMVLGDHQPVREAALSDLWHVPLHVAGPEDLVSRFLAQGFEPGARPAADSEPMSMQKFLPMFLRVLSEE